MLSRRDVRTSIVAAILAVWFAAGRVSTAPIDTATASARDAAGADRIARALDAVKADPNLATERTIKTLKWKSSGQQKSTGLPSWVVWIVGLLRWLEDSARYLVWAAAALLVGFVVVYLLRVLRIAGFSRRDEPFEAPTHVQDLDIRPESLPADVGAEARALWDRGDRRAALALLYRGLLSRLVHEYSVPIRDSSTEGECLDLAGSRLTPHRNDYAGRLVRVWQRAVYGREEVEPALVYALCRDFAALLDRPAREPA